MTGSVYKRRLRDRNIRLIQILPGSFENQLECRFIEISLNDSPVFRALSYVWGDSTTTAIILCDGAPLSITLNLAAALRRLRGDITISHNGLQPTDENASDANFQKAISNDPRVASDLLLWVDAICIDQEDSDERSHQVQLMKEIYSDAVEVIVWLGDAYDVHIERAMKTIEYVHGVESARLSKSYQDGDNQVEEKHTLTYDTLRNWLSAQEWDPLASLHRFFGNSWWDRIWCVQEVTLARKVIVLLGPRMICIEAISSFADWNFGQGWNTVSGYIDTQKARTRFQRNSSRGAFMDILNKYRDLQATDPRDKVYGLLGLVEGPSLKADYTRSTTEVYVDVVKFILRTDRMLEILSCVEHHEGVDRRKIAPSWVPRWDQAQNARFLWSNGSPMSAGFGSFQFTDQSIIAIENGVLQLSGVPFDTVTEVSHPIDVNILDIEKDRIFQGICLDLAGVMRGYVSALGYPHAPQPPGSTKFIKIPIPEAAQQFILDALIFTRMLIYYTASFGHHETAEEQARAMFRLFWALCMHRRLFRTSKGCVGLGPKCMQPGDEVVVLNGGKVPYVLTPWDKSKDEYTFLGECYIHSIMNGEAYDMWRPKQDVVFKLL